MKNKKYSLHQDPNVAEIYADGEIAPTFKIAREHCESGPAYAAAVSAIVAGLRAQKHTVKVRTFDAAGLET